MTKRQERALAKKQAKADAAAKNAALTTGTPSVTPEVILPEQDAPIVKPLNKVVFSLYQNCTKKATKTVDGVKVEFEKPVVHNWEASFETREEIQTAPLSDWIISQLANYQVMQKHQGRSRFDTTLPIEFDMKVNNETAAMGLKFSTNAKAIERLFTSNPGVMARVFNPTSAQYSLDKEVRKQNREETKRFLEGNLNIKLADAVTISPVEALKELIAPVTTTIPDPTEDGIEEEVGVNNGQVLSALD